jgi:conjugal transfer pilus assembly protein TraF
MNSRAPNSIVRRNLWLSLILACVVISVKSSVAEVPLAPASAAPDKAGREGYWWRKEAPPEVPDARELPTPPSEAELLKLHPKEVEKLLQDYRDFALWKLNPEHVTWYYYLQDFARRRSRAFMNVTDLVMLENPALNMNTVYPESPPGQDARLAQYNTALDSRLDQERDRAALVLLTRKGCPYCDAQRGALKYFQQRHGWEVREFDIDENPQVGAKFSVDYTPTTVVIFRDSEQWMPVSVGVDTVPAIEAGLYKALRLLHGETSPQQFDLTEYQDGGPYDPNARRRQ